MARFRTLLRILTTAAVLVLTVVCCWQCIDIYLSGTQTIQATGASVFTMPDVFHRLTKLSPIFLICLGVIIVSLAFQLSSSSENTPLVSAPEYRLKQLKDRFETLPGAARKEATHRQFLRTITGCLLFIFLIPVLLYLLNASHFTEWNLEIVLKNLLTHSFPWLVFAFITSVTASHLILKSIQKEILVLRNSPKSAQRTKLMQPVKQSITVIRYVLLAAALLLIVLGILNGGLYDVFVKAINICTECIGLG